MRTFAPTLVFSILAGLARSQNETIDPDSVDIAQRREWCLKQTTACPLLCLQLPGNAAGTTSNECDADTLVYSCVCDNGLSPNASEYSQTIPYYICTEYVSQCQRACGSDNTCSNNCLINHPCGAQNPTRVNSSTITTMPATATATGSTTATGTGGVNTADFEGFGGTAATTGASKKNGAPGPMALEIGQAYGLGMVVTGLLAGFALIL